MVLPLCCIHCGQPVYRTKDWNEIRYCCPGCQAVHAFISSHDLGSYYDWLKKMGYHGPSQQDRLDPENTAPETLSQEFLNNFMINSKTYGVFIPAMRCAACLWLIEKVLAPLPIKNLDVDLFKKRVTFEIGHDLSLPEENVLKREQNIQDVLQSLLAVLNHCGYTPVPLFFEKEASFLKQQERSQLKDIAIAGFATGNVMLFAISVYFGRHQGMTDSMQWFFSCISAAVSVPCLIYAGRSFFIHAWKALRAGHMHIDMPISVALGVCLAYSMYQTVIHGPFVYYDTLTGLVFFLLIGRYFFDKMISKTQEMSQFVDQLLPMQSAFLKVGARIPIAVGQTIPADGKVVEGCSEVNEAILTGESLPVVKTVGAPVFAGSHNVSQALVIEILKVGEDTWVGALKIAMEAAKKSRSVTQDLIAKAVPWFTWGIFVAAVVAAGWQWKHFGGALALQSAIAVLVVACPCALALATPLAFYRGIYVCWKRSVIVKSAHVFESFPKIKSVLFDKTGTLTESRMNVVNVEFFQDTPADTQASLLSHIAAICRPSLHPISQSLWHGFGSENLNFCVQLEFLKEVPGQGLFYHPPLGPSVRIGKPEFVGLNPDFFHKKALGSTVYCDYNGVFFAIFLQQSLRAGAKQLVDFLKKKKIDLYIASGDSCLAVDAIANQLSIPVGHARGGMSAEQKGAWLDELSLGGPVLAFGDGVNDVSLLAKAAVSVGVHGSCDLALQAADVFFLNRTLNDVVWLFQWSEKVNRTVLGLLILNILYNGIVVVCAGLGWMTPLWAAVLMPSSSLLILSYVMWCL